MPTLQKVGIALGLGVYYVVVKLVFLPTTILLFLGRHANVKGRIGKLLIFSDERLYEVRDDLGEHFTAGADQMLEYNNTESIPVSRHHFRRVGLQHVKQIEDQLNAGEILVSSFLALLGIAVSVVSFVTPVQRLVYSITGKLSVELLTIISIATASVGVLVLFMVSLRIAIVDYLTFEDGDFASGSEAEFLMKMVWNQMVAERPGKIVQMYYLFLVADLLGENVYSACLMAFEEVMHPEKSGREVMLKYLPAFMGEEINPTDPDESV